MEIGTRENTSDATVPYSITAIADTASPNTVAWSCAQSDNICPSPSRQSPSVRRDTIASTNATPRTIADPLSHSATNAEYHGAEWPPGSQFTSGRKPQAVPRTANATANHRVGDRECDVESTLATRNLTVKRDRQATVLDRQPSGLSGRG
jgi:hypothetical protein